MNVPSGKSTYVSWAIIALAVAGAVIEAIDDGLGWTTVALAGIGAAMAAIYRITAASQANHLVDQTIVTDEPSVLFSSDDDDDDEVMLFTPDPDVYTGPDGGTRKRV